jgi:RNA polymerase-interacting CarD/CdnL/TRCF family regulator
MPLSFNGKFQRGDYVCHKYMGAGQIRRIHRDGDEVIYEIKMVLGCEQVLVCERAARDILRPISEKCIIDDVLRRLAQPFQNTELSHYGWQMRERLLNEKMKSNDIREVTDIYRYLETLKAKRTLSERDRRFHETAFRILASEISLVLRKPVKEVEVMLRSNGHGVTAEPGLAG